MSTMSLRLLFGMLASALPNQHNYSETMEAPEKEYWASKFQLGEGYAGIDFAGAARLHIGMLTISLLVGLGYGGYVAYTCWTEKDVFLGYIRNLVIALVCRTFFTIIFDGVILLGSPFNVGGGNTLSALEQIFINLVLGFWLSLTVYAHARVQRNFKSEPTLRLYQYGIPAVAAFFAFVWIFSMQDVFPKFLWWAVLIPFSSWIVHSANLLFLLVQLALVVDMGRMMMPIKSSLDNDSRSLLWKVAAMMAALIFIFWLQFGLSLGYYKLKQSYLYFFFFIDGIEGTLVSVCFYFFYRWVTPLREKSLLTVGSGEAEITPVDEKETEVLPGGRGIVTVDSICVTTESGRWKTSEDNSSKDVVYSNVVEPHRLQKTLELYKRFNVIPNQVTVVDGEQFYDCHIPIAPERANQKASPALTTKKMEPIQKKNAFYASKYLILDSKEGEIPKYLETRPSVSSVSESPKEEQRSTTDSFSGFEAGERVRKWLKENSENMPKEKKSESMIEEKELSREDSDVKTSEPSTETTEENLSVEKVDNNCVELGKQSIPKPVAKPRRDTRDTRRDMSLDLNTEHDAITPETETPTGGKQETHNGTTSEDVPSESLIALRYYGKLQPEMKEPEVKDKPMESIKPYLTYSELVELRSKREKSDERPASNTGSIFSKVINAGSHFLTALTGFAQADKDFTTDERHPRQPQTKDEQKVQIGETLKELPPEEAKPQSNLTVSSLPEKPTAEQVEDSGARPESIKETVLTPGNEIKSDGFDIRGMQNLEAQSFIADREEVPQEIIEEMSSLESSLGSDGAQQKPTEYRKQSLKPVIEPFIERQALDITKVQPPHKLTEDEEKPLEGEGSKLPQQALHVNTAQPPQKLIQDYEELVETSSDSEFSIEKRQSYSSVLRKPTKQKEKPVEKFSGLESARESFDFHQQPKNAYSLDVEDASSDSEFSIERQQSFTERKQMQNNALSRTVYAATSQSDATATSDSKVTLDRMPSSSSCESFSLREYYNKILRDRSQFQN